MERGRQTEAQAVVLYDLYPRHVGRGAAIRSIKRSLKEESFEFLKQAVEEYAEFRNMMVGLDPSERQFTPHPSTWFNQERYHDDREEWSIPGPAIPTEQAWNMVRGAVREYGRSKGREARESLPEAVAKAVHSMGWPPLCDMTEHSRPQLFKAFKRVYESG